MGRPAKSLGRDTRVLILQHALELFSRRGYFGTSMRDIGRAVGVRESALYHHFESKQAILRALIGELGPARAEVIGASMSELLQKAPAAKVLRAVAARLVEDWTSPREGQFMRLMLAEGLRINELTDFYPLAQVERARGVLAGMFEQLIARRAIRRADPRALAIAFIGPLMMLRMVHLIVPATGRPEVKRLKADVERFLDLFVESIRPVRLVRGAR
jgi:AcrR family transcriptional regulator